MTDHEKTPVGILGVGLLGTALAERLLRQGFSVFGYDIDSKRLDSLAAVGGSVSANAGDVLRRCSNVLISLPTSTIAKTVFDNLNDVVQRGQTIIDTTTGDPREMIQFGASFGKLGVNYIEATIAGSSVDAREGRAVIFLGGDHRAIETSNQVLAAISPHCFHLGSVGTASRFKLVHNLVLGLNRAVLAEGLAFAQSIGFDASQTLEILKQTPAVSGVMEVKGRKMVEQDWEPQARLSQHLKDVRLILAEAEREDAKTPLSKVHRELLEKAEELGFGDSDNSAIIQAYRR